MTSVRVVLTVGVAVFVLVVGGLVGSFSMREVHRVTLRGRSQETQVYSID